MQNPWETWKAKPNHLLRSRLIMRSKQRPACLLVSVASVWFGFRAVWCQAETQACGCPPISRLMMHCHKTNSFGNHGGPHEPPLKSTASAASRAKAPTCTGRKAHGFLPWLCLDRRCFLWNASNTLRLTCCKTRTSSVSQCSPFAGHTKQLRRTRLAWAAQSLKARRPVDSLAAPSLPKEP